MIKSILTAYLLVATASLGLMAARSVFVIGFTFLSLWGLSHNPYAQHAMLLQIVPVMTALAGLQTAAAHGHAGTAGLMMYLQMPTALVLGWLVLNEVPKFNAVAGAAVIVCAGVVLVVMQTRQQYGTKPIPD